VCVLAQRRKFLPLKERKGERAASTLKNGADLFPSPSHRRRAQPNKEKRGRNQSLLSSAGKKKKGRGTARRSNSSGIGGGGGKPSPLTCLKRKKTAERPTIPIIPKNLPSRDRGRGKKGGEGTPCTAGKGWPPSFPQKKGGEEKEKSPPEDSRLPPPPSFSRT